LLIGRQRNLQADVPLYRPEISVLLLLQHSRRNRVHAAPVAETVAAVPRAPPIRSAATVPRAEHRGYECVRRLDQSKAERMTMAGRLNGKSSIVTGAATGIGEAIAHKFAREGAKVIVAGLSADPVEDVVHAIRARGGVAEPFLGDVADEVDAQACIALAIDAFGSLDILINNAGVFPEIAECQDHSVEMFDYIVRNNIRSAFLMTKFALPHLQRSRGVVISTGSEAGEMGEPTAAPYGGSKGFLHAFMRGVAYEQGKYGVRALCVCALVLSIRPGRTRRPDR
jgi:NAD(P)-dependent dehydrogenase (short-subunit alcohol dehydrogenase family)